jgi:hypothetical protein
MKKHLFSLLAMLTAFGSSALAIDQVNGVYKIGTADDYVAFAQIVNGGDRTANAILTANIDLGSTTTQIGVGGDYQGLFDGKGYSITIALPDRTDGEGPALFRGIGNRGIVQNLKVQGTITTGTYKHSAAIANYTAGIIRCCFADVTFNTSFGDNADASIGGIAGQLNRPAIIENCLSKIKIIGSTTHKCGGLAAWVDAQRVNIVNCLVINDENSNFYWADNKSAGLVRDGDGLRKAVNLTTYNADSYKNRPEGANANNYVTNDWGVLSLGTTVVTPQEVASGKVCYQLNSDQSHIGWVQNIGDPYPVPAVFGTDKGQVYASAPTNCQGKADGEVTFSNTPSNAVVTPHTYDRYGVCTTCGQFNWKCFDFDDPTRFDPATKSVLLGSADDLFLAEGWNRLQNGFKLNMKMVNDITCTPPTGQLIFNSNDWMDSNFDGDGHAITINFVDIKENCAAFLPMFDGNFENVIMHGSISTANQYAGSIAGRFYGNGQKIRNVFSDITINSTKSGDNTTGGFVGITAANAAFENCIYAGDINGIEGTTCLGGLIGWANGSNHLTNCAFLGTMTNAGGDSHTISRNNGNANCTNVYSLNEYNNSDAGKYTKTTADAVASGELAYLLNGKENGAERFYQLIGTDEYPMPIAKEGATVYAIVADGYRCDGTPLGDATFTNTETTPVIPAHQFDADGICTVCGNMETDEEGYYKIVSGRGLALFAELVNGGQTNLKGRVYNDIDYTAYPKGFIGTESKKFSGTFDGQMYTITTGIKNDTKATGLFGSVINATIQNLVLDGSVESSDKWIGGICGITRGNTLIENVIVKSTVKFTGTGDSTGGGLCGDMESGFTVKNCAFLGSFDMPNGTNVGGLVSWTGSGTFTNCYVAPVEVVTNNSYKDFVSGGGGNCTNCYAMANTDPKLASGELCFKLGGAFGQVIGVDAYPTPATVTGYNEVRYDEELGYYNPLPVKIKDCKFENVISNDIVKSADINGEITLTGNVENITGNAVALIMDATEYAQKGVISGKHLFGAVGKNGGITVDENGKVIVKFTSFSTHTDQPNFVDSLGLAREDVGDVKAGDKYVVVIYGGSLVIEGKVWPENIVGTYDGKDVISLVIDQAVRALVPDDPTAINGINADKNAEIYSISGTRVNKAQKGVYIINGKKVVNE